jgi:hypothetical protein
MGIRPFLHCLCASRKCKFREKEQERVVWSPSRCELWVRCCTNNQHQTNSSRLVRSNYSRMGIRPFLNCLCASWKYNFGEKEQERVVRSSSRCELRGRCCTNNQHQTNSSRLVRSNYSSMGIRPFLNCLCASWKYNFREKEQERVVRSPFRCELWVRCCTGNQHQTNSSRLVRSNYSRMGIRPFLHCLCASWKYNFREKEQERAVRSPVKARCGCITAPTTSIKRTLHVSFALIFKHGHSFFHIAFAHHENTTSVKKSKEP